MTAALPQLATTMIGSCAQPSWYVSALEAIVCGEVGQADVQEAAEDASTWPSTTRSGLDWTSSATARCAATTSSWVYTAAWTGCARFDRVADWAPTCTTAPVISKPPVRLADGLGTGEELGFARSSTSKPVKVAVARPLTLANAIQLSAGYSGREALMADLVEVVRRELEDLAAAGCRFIQVDEEPVHARHRTSNTSGSRRMPLPGHLSRCGGSCPR